MSSVVLPMVSCIMPTFNRRPFVRLAIDLFRRQRYAAKELVIIDDGNDRVDDLVRGQAGVRYFRVDGRASVGDKRNLACQQARGELIAHWDDDDWYGPNRLLVQVAPIVLDQADLSTLELRSMLELPAGVLWSLSPERCRQLFPRGSFASLLFRRSLLVQGLRYPEVSAGEDVALVRAILERGGRLARMPNEGTFVYVRHSTNTWDGFRPARDDDPDGWERGRWPEDFLPDTRSAYVLAASTTLPLQPRDGDRT
jgi:O-antigen biosynthesis protein